MSYSLIENLDTLRESKEAFLEELDIILPNPSGLTIHDSWDTIGTFINNILVDNQIFPPEVVEELERLLGNTLQKTIQVTATKINPYTFYGESSLVAINASNAATISQYAFYNCTDLKLANLQAATSIGSYAFNGCNKLETVDLDSTVNVGDYAFANCQKLENIDFSKISYINSYAFQYCYKINNLDLSNCNYIGSYAFDGCSAIGPTLYLDNTGTIGNRVFNNCSNIREIIITNKSKSLNQYALRNIGAVNRILCEYPSKPSSWNSNWNYSNYPVYWNAEIKDWVFVYNNDKPNSTLTARIIDEFPNEGTKDGYAFDGWYTDSTLETRCELPYTSPEAFPVLYAKWQKQLKIYTVNIEDGDLLTFVGNYAVYSMETLPKDRYLSGKLRGWYLDATLETPLLSVDSLVPLTPIYAKITNMTTYEFEYTGHAEEFDAPIGEYTLECWGAQGGAPASVQSFGKGGYSCGTLVLNNDTNMTIYVGGQGQYNSNNAVVVLAGGFNGGGSCYSYDGSYHSSSGGGASDIRLNIDSVYSRVIVAGGGGGTGYTGSQYRKGGDGGGISGTAGETSSGYSGGGAGQQNSGGAKGTNSNYSYSGNFGSGGQQTGSGGGWSGCGGGGGWYGGGSGGAVAAGGGGGSGYVYTTESSQYYPAECLLNSDYYLIDTLTADGSSSFTAPNGDIEIGHAGNGYVRLTKKGSAQYGDMTVNIYGVINNNELVNVTSFKTSENVYTTALPETFDNYKKIGNYFYDDELTQQVVDVIEIQFNTTINIYCEVENQSNPLPQEYDWLEYIQGNTNAYIDTKLKANSSTQPKIEIKFMCKATVNDTGLYQTDWAANAFMMELKASNSTTQLEVRNHATANSVASSYVNPYVGIPLTMTVSYDGKLNIIAADGQTYSQNNTAMSSSSSANLTLFRCTYNNTNFGGRLYYCKIWQGSTLARYYVPCQRKADHKVGLYDLVTKEFYTTASSGEFTAGQVMTWDTDQSTHIPTNLFDEVWTIGYYNQQGGIGSTTSGIRGVNFINVQPSTTYYSCYTSPIYIQEYDSNKNHIKGDGVANGQFTTSNSTYFIRINPNSSYGQIYNNNINWTIGQRYTYNETKDCRIFIDTSEIEE